MNWAREQEKIISERIFFLRRLRRSIFVLLVQARDRSDAVV